jgi:SecD/SecF fusion protein
MDGSKVTLATARRSSESVGFEIGVRFSASGQVDFGNLTAANVGKRMAIMLDGQVHSAPTIQEAIHGECRISGRFDQEEAEKLAGVLTAGSLPAEVKYENEFTVGPTLGQQQIASGMQATVIGTAVVILFMLVYYRMNGAIASLCTDFNILMLLGAMGFFKATLTLPGIAGIVLTLGMSVDANVLILERIREEYQRGRPVRLAVAHGFDRAFLTIIDCNLTTLISGVVLYYLGTGPVRGFAVTLSIGILTTLLCNLWINQIIMEWLVSREALAKLTMMQFFKTTNIDFMGQRRFWITITVSLAALSLAAFLTFSDRLYDVDFKGGTLVQFNFAPGKPQDFEPVKKKVEGEVADGVKQRAEKFLADLKAKVQLEAAPATGEASGALQERRIAEIEKSMKTFSLAPQPFGTPEQGKYRSFTITTSATDPGIIEQLEKQLMETFKDKLEPPAIAREGNMLKVRLNAAPGLTPEIAQQRVTDAVIEAARDPIHTEIQEPLKALLNNAKAETEGNYIAVSLSPLPPDPNVAQKIENAMGTVKIEGRTSGAISRKSSFGSQVASEMWLGALIALIVANVGVFIYLWFRFEFSGAWGFGAIVALIHDTLIALGGLIAANLAGFPLLIDLNVVAALLTIIGYSVNDTIVVFDRIREVKGAHPTRPYEEIVNEAVNATLSRTILTSLTVLLADASLLIFGGQTIRGLAWTLLVGFTVGTYSSIFIASPLMVWWYRRFGGGQAPVPVSTSRQQQKEDMAEGAEV